VRLTTGSLLFTADDRAVGTGSFPFLAAAMGSVLVRLANFLFFTVRARLSYIQT